MHDPRPKTRTLLRRPNQRIPLRLLKRRELKIIRQLELGFGVVLAGQEVDDEGVFDGEDGVVGEVFVAAVENLGDDGFVVWGGDLWGGGWISSHALVVDRMVILGTNNWEGREGWKLR